MSVDSVEASEQDSSPRELYEFTVGAQIYRLTSADHDVAYGNSVYKATPIARGDIGPPAVAGRSKEVAVTLPIDHAIARRYLKQGVPPQSMQCRILRLYHPSGDVEQIWNGPVLSMSCNDDNTEATFRVVSRVAEAMLRVIPTLTLSRNCSHMLYDSTCGIDRTDTGPDGFPYKHTTTVISVNGRVVRLDLSTVTAGHARRADWLALGELVHVASGERRTIAEQNDISPGVSTVTDVTLNLQIPDLKVGDSIQVFAGCKLDPATCDLKFDNMSRYSGCAYLPTSNPYVPGTKVEV